LASAQIRFPHSPGGKPDRAATPVVLEAMPAG
jgi:hypothetical protein